MTPHQRSRSPRSLACHLGLAIGCLGLAIAALGLGRLTFPPAEILQVLAGESPAATRLVVVEWRLPRVAAALSGGAALGMAGALFQTILRNPLGSPDVIGCDAGAFLGAILAMLASASVAIVAAGAFAGGLSAGLLVYAAAGSARTEPSRLILIGIALGAGLGALNDWLILVAPIDTALVAASWKQGALAAVDPERLVLGIALLAPLLLLGLAGSRSLRALELGDDKALSLGEPAGRARLRFGLLGLGLTATATLIAGPVGFVALIAPQAARRLLGSPGLPLTASALFGALFLLASDCVARLAFAPRTLPVGVVTACLGGVCFVLLLLGIRRREATW